MSNGVRAERVSAFGLRSSRARCPDGLQDVGVPGVQQEGERPGRYADALWLVGGKELLVHDAHVSDGRKIASGCRICRKGSGALLAKVQGTVRRGGVVQGAGVDKSRTGALSLPGDQSRGKGRDLPAEDGQVRGVEGEGVSAADWFKELLGTPDK